MKGAVLACEIFNDSDRFYNKKIEGINKLIKKWEEYRKVDLFTFIKEYEELVRCQERDIQKAFLGLDSPIIVKERYSEKNRNSDTDFKYADQNEKLKFKQDIFNVIVEPKQYSKVIKFRPGKDALQNTRTRLEHMLTNEENFPNNVEESTNCRATDQLDEVVSHIVEDSNKEEGRQTKNDLDAIVFLMSEALPNIEDGGIRG